MKNFNEKAAIEIDYLSLYKCKPHHETDLGKLIYYVMEMRKKIKNNQKLRKKRENELATIRNNSYKNTTIINI